MDASGRARAIRDPGDAMALGRFTEPDEVAETVEFLLSYRTSAVTGANLAMDRGWAVRDWVLYGRRGRGGRGGE